MGGLRAARPYPEALSAFKTGKGSSVSKLRTAALAHVFARSGNHSGAEELLSDLLEKSKSQYVSAYDIAVVHEGLGNAIGPSTG